MFEKDKFFIPQFDLKFQCGFKYDVNQYTDIKFEELSIACPDLIRGAVNSRKASFLAGRYCVQTIFDRLGVKFEVAMASNRAPIWPAGYTGSITHTKDRAFAVALPSSQMTSIGVDIERIMSLEKAKKIEGQIIDDQESAILGIEDFGMKVSLAFSAKESVYKCIAPMTGRFYNFSDVHITSWKDNSFVFSVAGSSLPNSGFSTFFEVQEQHVITAVCFRS